MNGGAGEVTVHRAFGALSFEEERHEILGRAHLLLAAKCRNEQLAFSLREEFDRNLRVEASDEVLADREAMLLAMQARGLEFYRCSAELRNDPEIILAAFRSCPPAMLDTSLETRDNRNLMLQAVRINGSGLQYASQRLRGDKEIVLAAVASEPKALMHANDALRSDRTVVLAALQKQTLEEVNSAREHGAAVANVLYFASEDLRADRAVVLEAVRVDASAVAFASLELRQDKDFLLQMARAAPERERHLCYWQAAESFRESTPFENFEGAANSALALAGVATTEGSIGSSCLPWQEAKRHLSCQSGSSIQWLR